MGRITMTRQEKKALAVAYGFLVEVWTAQQSKLGVMPEVLRQGKSKARIKNNC